MEDYPKIEIIGNPKIKVLSGTKDEASKESNILTMPTMYTRWISLWETGECIENGVKTWFLWMYGDISESGGRDRVKI